MITSFIGEDATEALNTFAQLAGFDTTNYLATFDGINSALDIGSGVINGMIDVLPTQSFLKYCRDNGTLINDEWTDFRTNWGVDNELALDSFQSLLEGQAGFSFNCFYSVKDPTASGSTSLSIKLFGWNILYNLGYMYTDIKKSKDIIDSSTD